MKNKRIILLGNNQTPFMPRPSKTNAKKKRIIVSMHKTTTGIHVPYSYRLS